VVHTLLAQSPDSNENPRVQEKLRWRSLIPGVAVVAVLSVMTVGVLVYGRVGALHGDLVHLHIVAPEAGGVLPGSEVWYAGRKIGRVQRLDVMPPSQDSMARIVVDIEVLEKHATLVRRNSSVRIVTGGRLLGAPVVAIEGGGVEAGAAGDGDTLRAGAGGMLGSTRERVMETREQLPELATNARLILADLKQISAMSGRAAQQVPMQRASAVMAQGSSVAGKFGRLMGGGGNDGLRDRVVHIRAQVESLRVAVASPTGNFGRFRADSTLGKTVDSLRAEVARLSEAASSTDGTLGRLAADSALQREMSALRQEMAALFADIKKRPLRYISF
jgi:hypothetical protein